MEEKKEELMTVAQSPKQELEYNIMKALRIHVDSRKEYLRLTLMNGIGNLSKVRSSLVSLIDLIEPALQDSFEKNHPINWNKIQEVLNPEKELDFKEVNKTWKIINRWLYDKNLTKLDLRKQFDTTNIWEDNASNGYT